MQHIAITKADINGSEVNSVNARDLHDKLGVKTTFTTWINRAIEKYDLAEGVDYESLSILQASGQTHKEYAVSMDMAKELSMLENNTEGKKWRKYFISIEKQATQPQKQMTHLETAKMLVQSLEQVEKLELRVEHQTETIKAVAQLNVHAGEVTISKFCKNINIKDMGSQKMCAWLRSKKVLQQNNDPLQTVVNSGYMVMRPSKDTHGGKVRYTTMLTPKGTVWLTKVLKKSGFEVEEVA